METVCGLERASGWQLCVVVTDRAASSCALLVAGSGGPGVLSLRLVGCAHAVLLDGVL